MYLTPWCCQSFWVQACLSGHKPTEPAWVMSVLKGLRRAWFHPDLADLGPGDFIFHSWYVFLPETVEVGPAQVVWPGFISAALGTAASFAF